MVQLVKATCPVRQLVATFGLCGSQGGGHQMRPRQQVRFHPKKKQGNQGVRGQTYSNNKLPQKSEPAWRSVAERRDTQLCRGHQSDSQRFVRVAVQPARCGKAAQPSTTPQDARCDPTRALLMNLRNFRTMRRQTIRRHLWTMWKRRRLPPFLRVRRPQHWKGFQWL